SLLSGIEHTTRPSTRTYSAWQATAVPSWRKSRKSCASAGASAAYTGGGHSTPAQHAAASTARHEIAARVAGTLPQQPSGTPGSGQEPIAASGGPGSRARLTSCSAFSLVTLQAVRTRGWPDRTRANTPCGKRVDGKWICCGVRVGREKDR